MLRGFLSDEHQAAFKAGRELARRGGAAAKICGARTKHGAACQSAPLKGHWRCLRHAGPKAARELRDRQLRDLALGRLSVEAFAKLEARRAANQLRIRWRRDPWAEGATIDLGDQESAFQRATARVLWQAPPAVADWLRWQFFRFRIRSDRPLLWQQAVDTKLPTRLGLARLPLATLARARVPSVGPSSEGEGGHVTTAEPTEAEFMVHGSVRSLLAGAKSAADFDRRLQHLLHLRQNPNDVGAWEQWVRLLVTQR